MLTLFTAQVLKLKALQVTATKHPARIYKISRIRHSARLQLMLGPTIPIGENPFLLPLRAGYGFISKLDAKRMYITPVKLYNLFLDIPALLTSDQSSTIQRSQAETLHQFR